MKKKISLIILSAVLISMIAACGGNSETEEVKKIKEGIQYYADEFETNLPDLAEEQNRDRDKMIAELTSAIEKSKEFVDIYTEYMDNEDLGDNVREAAQNLKTAYYGIQTTALEPLLNIFKTDSGEAPEYGQIVEDAKELYVNKAEELIK